ncbi:MAG: sulfatase [Acidimicrobiales bacterium]|nr:sulfatase [Acidimicrobiales bacterium]
MARNWTRSATAGTVSITTALITLLLLLPACSRTPGSSAPLAGQARGTTQQRAADPRPNIVLIMTDDQTLGELKHMPKVKRYLTDEGTNFANYFASFPLCCPARATLLTGQYAHNHGVLDNVPPLGGNDRLDHSQTLPVWLQQVGYRTGHVGKYLNGYGDPSAGNRPATVPPGYDDWFGLVDCSPSPCAGTLNYWGFKVLDNGTERTYGDSDDEYQTDVLAARAVQDIDRFTREGKPFYLTVWPLAPHSGQGRGIPQFTLPDGRTVPIGVAPAAAPRHQSMFLNETAPRAASTFESDLSDKPAIIQSIRREVDEGLANLQLDPNQIREILDITYRARLQSLQAVDDLVEQVVRALERTGQLDNTIIAFSSDNGWMFGEHGLVFTKVVLYDESVRVPMIVRGPGFPKARVVTQPTTDADWVPTVLEVTGASAPFPVDGEPLTQFAADPNSGKDRAVLLEAWHQGRERSWQASGVRVAGFVYIEWDTGDRELYDLFNDPFQLDNKADNPVYARTQARLATALDELRSCLGQGCSVVVAQQEVRRSPD